MQKTLSFLIVLPGFLLIAACGKDRGSSRPATTAELRIFNATSENFYDCTIDPSGTLSDNPGADAYNFGEVDSNDKTPYHSFTNLYRYSWVRLTMKNKTYYLKPYDYTNETVLQTGRYTYKLTYSTVTDQLGLELIAD